MTGMGTFEIVMVSAMLVLIAVLAMIAYWVFLIKSELVVHTKQNAKLNWLLLRKNRTREGQVKTQITNQSPPRDYKLTERRRSG